MNEIIALRSNNGNRRSAIANTHIGNSPSQGSSIGITKTSIAKKNPKEAAIFFMPIIAAATAAIPIQGVSHSGKKKLASKKCLISVSLVR